MNSERLEKLRTVAHGLGMLHDHPHHPAARAIGDLDPVAAERGLRREIDGDGGDCHSSRVSVQLGDEKIVVLHPQRELLHVNVVDGPIAGAQK